MKFMFGLQHPLSCNPSTTLSNPCNKVRGQYFSKAVFMRPLFLRFPSCVLYSCVCYHWVGMYPVYICMQQVYPATPAYWISRWGVLPLWSDAVGVSCNPSLLDLSLRSLTPLKRCSRCILQLQPTGPLVGESYPSGAMQSVYAATPAYWISRWGVLPLWSDAVGVSCNPSLLDLSLRSLTPLKRCSRCILQLQPTGPLVGESYPSGAMQSVYAATPAYWISRWGVLPLWSDAVGVCCNPSLLDLSLRSLTPLKRCSRCILQLQPTGPLVGESYPSGAMQSVYSATPADWAIKLRGLFNVKDILAEKQQVGQYIKRERIFR